MPLKELTERITRVEHRLQQIQDHSDTLQLALSWTLAKHPDDEVLHFLRSQANEFEFTNPLKFQEWIDTLDDLTEDVTLWRDQWSSDPG